MGPGDLAALLNACAAALPDRARRHQAGPYARQLSEIITAMAALLHPKLPLRISAKYH